MKLPAPSPSLEATFPHRHDRALAYLRGLLLDGGLEPDQIISTEDVARSLGISRAPTTDAIKRLSRDGFMDVVPQVGCRVRSPGPDEVADFYELFSRSEALITGFAAERRTAAQAAAFKSLADEVEEQIGVLMKTEGSGPALRALNRRRYEVIHELAGSAITSELVANMWDRSDFYIRVAYGQFVFSRSVQAANFKIANAVFAGDRKTAATESESYLASIGKLIAAELR
jgi:DNA-binding GntR family transcriptional regulator